MVQSAQKKAPVDASGSTASDHQERPKRDRPSAFHIPRGPVAFAGTGLLLARKRDFRNRAMDTKRRRHARGKPFRVIRINSEEEVIARANNLLVGRAAPTPTADRAGQDWVYR
jgi:hypothetical protein